MIFLTEKKCINIILTLDLLFSVKVMLSVIWNTIFRAMSNSPMLLLLSCLVIYDKCEGIGIGWMKVDNNGRATAAEHQVTTN